MIHAAVNNSGKKPVVFLYLGQQASGQQAELFRLVEPHLNDEGARIDLGRANHQAEEAKVECRFIYRHQEPDAVYNVWETTHPYDTIIAVQQDRDMQKLRLDRTYEEATPFGKVEHLVKEKVA